MNNPAPIAPGDSSRVAGPPTRVEWCLLAAIVLVGFALRVAFPSRIAVEHFDEGVYASNFWFGPESGFQYPGRQFYAPPLLPWLIEWTFILFGPSNIGAVAVNIVAGTLTVPLVWWVGRRWFGPVAGLSSATLAALSDIHILYSRTALTDVPLCFWLLAAVYCLWEALVCSRHTPCAVAVGNRTVGPATAPSPRGEPARSAADGTRSVPVTKSIIAAGVTTALAWWTKYNGWLPLAIGLAGLIAWSVFAKPEERRLKARLTTWLVVAALAFALWLPYLWELQDYGGYGPIAANHRGYLVGWSGWWESANVHLTNFANLFRWLTSLGIWLGPILSSLSVRMHHLRCQRRFTWNARVDGFECGRLAGWMLAAWIGALTLTTPLYMPYPRLMLPWVVGLWMAFGLLLALTVDSEAPARNENGKFKCQGLPWWFLFTIVFTVLGAQLFSHERGPIVPAWEPRTGLASIAGEAVSEMCREARLDPEVDRDKFIIYVYGEPALLFQLRLAGAANVLPVAHFEFAKPQAAATQVPTFVIAGPHADRSPQFAKQLEAARPRLQLVRSFDYAPSDLVLLDNRDARDRPRPAGNRLTYPIHLWRVR